MTHTILVIDDHPLFRDALRLAIAPRLGAKVLEANGMEGGRAQLEAHQASGEIDLVLLDLNLPDVQGLAGLASLRASHADVPVAIVSGTDDAPLVRRCMRLGAAGFIPKSLSAEETTAAVRTVLDGGSWTPDISEDALNEEDEIVTRLATLTPQQVRVLGMLAQGMLNKQIAFELSVSEATVKAHVSAILAKLGVDSRTQAVIQAAKVDQAEWQGVHAA